LKFNSNAILIWFATYATYARANKTDSPCLSTCSGDGSGLTYDTLQKCVDKCFEAGHCCGNRLDGVDTASSNQRLSCANGCEMAFYSSEVSQCKQHCSNRNICEYKHPAIRDPFRMCGSCDCGQWPEDNACDYGCDQAELFSEFYQYSEDAGCETEEIPRFLFAGQSNMEGNTEEAKPGLFTEIVDTIKGGGTKAEKLEQMEADLNDAKESTPGSSEKEAKDLYKLRRIIKKRNFHTTTYKKAVCGWTNPAYDTKLDCERPVSPTACGNEFGPELMFAHVFPRKKGPLKKKKIGIIKVAQGGTEINKHWMKANDGEEDNYWQHMVDAVKASKGSIEGFVWFQGENDSFESWNKENYLDNLTEFIADVRKEIYNSSEKFQSPSDVPVVIVELGNWIWLDVDPAVIYAQRNFVEKTPNTSLVNSGIDDNPNKRLSKFYHFEAGAMMIIGSRVAKAMAKLLKNS